MPRIRVLVVDDSAVIRRVVMEELSSDPAIEVVGTASNGKIALARLPQVAPDLVILDVEMPEMDGLAALAALRKDYPRLPVIMFSALTERGASATLDALALGATDYFTKPAGPGGLDEARRVIREELIPEIHALCMAKPQALPLLAPIGFPAIPRSGRIDIVVVGLSTGGPNALAELFAGLPAALPVPILIVQHMPPMFTRLLAERLAANTQHPVAEAEHGTEVLPGRTLIAPGDYHMEVARDGLRARAMLTKDPPENSCRPAVDPLFRTAAAVYRSGVLAVVLTGMGKDGLRGCEIVREAGGQILVQDEATSVVWGMPGYVARAGLADKVLPLPAIAGEIARRVGVAPAMTASDYAFVVSLLRDRGGIALETGKEYLVESRLTPLARRLGLASLDEFFQRLRQTGTNGLAADVVEAMVTTETSFFRDVHPFETLRTTVLPELIRGRMAEKRLSIWCAAASSGQEPYTVAILLREYFPELSKWTVSIKATDISEEMLRRCRTGKYSQIEVNRGLPVALLMKYFRQEGASWLIRDDLKAIIDFQPLNLAGAWPPMPAFDLVFLRNVMIYFDVETKKPILRKVGQVLRPDGYLLLGGAETTFNLDDSYRRVESLKSGFYQKIGT